MNDVSDEKNLQSILSTFDCLIAVVTFFVLFCFIYILNKNFVQNELRKIFLLGFLIKCLGAFSFVLMAKNYGAFDTLVYYGSILDLSRTDIYSFFNYMFTFNDSDLASNSLLVFEQGREHYMESLANGTVAKFGVLFSSLVFGSYSGLTLFYSTFSFLGSWCFFLAFYKLYPTLKNKLSLAILFLPSTLFWGSGLLKDSLTFGSLGILIYCFFEFIFHKSYRASFIFITLIAGYLLFTIKSYIFYTFSITIVFLILSRIKIFLRIRSFVLLIIIFLIFFYSSQILSGLIEEAKSQAFNYENVEAGSNVAFFEYDFSVLGIINIFLKSFEAVFFRPYIWEIRSPIMALSSIESLLFLLVTLFSIFKFGIINFFKVLKKSEIVSFCFLFSLFFSIIVATTTFNYGTLSRYKIPCLPFYLLMIFITQHISNTKKYKT